eukprot:scaffold705_cov402-Prasinococcus_capsulatus_cf.AAC.52
MPSLSEGSARFRPPLSLLPFNPMPSHRLPTGVHSRERPGSRRLGPPAHRRPAPRGAPAARAPRGQGASERGPRGGGAPRRWDTRNIWAWEILLGPRQQGGGRHGRAGGDRVARPPAKSAARVAAAVRPVRSGPPPADRPANGRAARGRGAQRMRLRAINAALTRQRRVDICHKLPPARTPRARPSLDAAPVRSARPAPPLAEKVPAPARPPRARTLSAAPSRGGPTCRARAGAPRVALSFAPPRRPPPSGMI